jgi:ribonucleoside-diphosphate reductase alpha chain
MGHTTNPEIPIAKSVVDYIFRWLGMTFLPENGKALPPAKGEVAKAESTKAGGAAPASNGASAANPGNGTATLEIDQNAGPERRSEQFARFQSDAPSCDNCGAITVRNGNCYLCYNCGNSMGCS